MDIPLTITIPIVAVAIIFPLYTAAVVFRGARRQTYSTGDALKLASQVGAILIGWGLTATALTAFGAFRDEAGRMWWMLAWFFGVIIIGSVGVARWTALDRVLAHRHTLGELVLSQTARWLGAIFLALHLSGQLPAFFAFPAGYGDILAGLCAIIAGVSLLVGRSVGIPIAFSVLGLLDFVGAVGTAALATQTAGLVHTVPPTSAFGQLPLALFPAYLVSFSIVLHITTIRILLSRTGKSLRSTVRLSDPGSQDIASGSRA